MEIAVFFWATTESSMSMWEVSPSETRYSNGLIEFNTLEFFSFTGSEAIETLLGHFQFRGFMGTRLDILYAFALQEQIVKR